MIQSMIDGMIAAIRTGYDETFKIYTKPAEQDFIKPCFSILCSNSTEEQKAGARRNKIYSYIVHYFPESDEPMQECLSVMENLYGLLEIIDTGSKKIRGKDMKSEIVDGVLKFEVTYALFVLAAEFETTMEEFEVKTNGS